VGPAGRGILFPRVRGEAAAPRPRNRPPRAVHPPPVMVQLRPSCVVWGARSFMRDDSEPGAALVGAVLANSYEITRLIGQGGMGTVYEGRQMRLGQRVAIKVMSADLSANREALARFRREAEVTSQIRHPHIVHVFDFGSTRTGQPFLVMEYLDGEDLDHRIARLGRLSLGTAVHIVKQTAAALAATHSKGIVHRDLKPANIFLLELEGEAEFVKIVDFGISKVKAATTKLTRSSVVMGTPDYMSPEQARGKVDEIDHRTDQWALAAITYEMLCGRPPFAGEDVASVLYQVTREEPQPLSARVRGVPLELERAVGRALSKRASDRYPSITAFSRALEEAAESTAIFSGAPETPPRHSSAVAKATVAYGGSGPAKEDAPDTLKGPSPDFPDFDDGQPEPVPVLAAKEPKRTTFSHATGEATLPFTWRQLRPTRRWALVGGLGAIVLVAGAVTLRASRHTAVERPIGQPQSASAPGARPVIAPLVVPPPSFVGPPAPSPSTFPAAPRIDSAALAPSRPKAGKAAIEGSLANPFEDDDVPTRGRAQATTEASPAVAPSPPRAQPPAPTRPTAPTDQPARPKRQIIKEL
jgi:eukaryotic-like serine/threonine-protein kinase